MAGTIPVRASVDSDPKIARSNPTCLSASARASDDATASEPGQRVFGYQHGLVGTHRQRLADRLRRLRRAHRQDGHLAAVRLGNLQCLLDGELVEVVMLLNSSFR
jgi:hypothetical protein